MYIGMRKYGVQTVFDFEVYDIDGVDLDTDWVPAAADMELIKDGGTSTQCTNTAVDEGVTYSITLTATEMQCARGVIKIQDAATKVILDKVMTFDTYGNASAQHAVDFDDAVRSGLTALPNAAAEAAGGLIVSTLGTTDADDTLTATGFATPTNITAGTITTTTNLTNLPTIPANWLTAAGTAADFTTEVVAGMNDLSAAQVQTEVDTALATIGLDHLISSALPTNWATDVAAGSVFDNVADDGTAVFDRTTDSLQAIRDNTAWDTATGFATPTNITAGTITTTTNLTNLPTIPADWLTAAGTAADFTTEIQTGLATPTNITAATGIVLSGVTHTSAVIPTVTTVTNAHADSDLTTALTELTQAIPSATPDMRDALMLMYMALRNKTVVQTSGTDALEIYNDAGTLIIKKLLTDDGSDYTEAEMVAGP